MRRLFLLTVLFLALTTQLHATTSHAEMMRTLAQIEFMREVPSKCLVSSVCVGRSVKGRSIPLVIIRDSYTPVEQTRRLFIISRQHGNEPASTEAMLHLIRAYSSNPKQSDLDLLQKVTFLIVPMMNPDGAGISERRNANNADLNRDWISLKQPETQAVARAIQIWQPDVIIDAHELDIDDHKADFIEYVSAKSGASYTTASACRDLQKLMISKLRTHGYRVKAKVIMDRQPACLAHRYFAKRKSIPTLLVESRQAGQRAGRIDQRVQLHIVSVMTVARCLSGEKNQLKCEISDWWGKRISRRETKRGIPDTASSPESRVGA